MSPATRSLRVRARVASRPHTKHIVALESVFEGDEAGLARTMISLCVSRNHTMRPRKAIQERCDMIGALGLGGFLGSAQGAHCPQGSLPTFTQRFIREHCW